MTRARKGFAHLPDAEVTALGHHPDLPYLVVLFVVGGAPMLVGGLVLVRSGASVLWLLALIGWQLLVAVGGDVALHRAGVYRGSRR